MRRSICIAEPGIALAGETGTWRFTFASASPLPAKAILRFDPISRGQEGDWELPQTNLRSKSNLIWLMLPDGKTVAGKPITEEEGFTLFEFVLPVAVNAGEKIVFYIGSPTIAEKAKLGTKSQVFTQRRRPFHLYVDPKGKGDVKEPEIFTLDVRGNALRQIRIITPSIVFKNGRFDVHIRFEDAFGNLTGNAPEGTLVELSYTQLRENLNWKLFVPETGFLTLPNIYFNEAGIYRLQLRNLSTGETFVSAPIECFLETGDQMFWGLLHGQSPRFNTITDVESALRHFRDDLALQFYATSCSEQDEITPSEAWKLIGIQVSEFNEEERFVSMLGFQWVGEPASEGCRHIIYNKDNKPLLRKKEAKSNSLKKIYKSHMPKDLLSIPCFTMAKGFSFDFDDFNPDFERVVEIYNGWGSSECLAKKGNSRPIKANSRKGISETDEGSIRAALNSGCRFGFVAGGIDHSGIYENLGENDQILYSPGFTAILAPEYSRDAAFNALYNRRCYATTGPRILVYFSIGGKPLGSELSNQTKPGLFYNRHISGFIAGLTELEEIVIFRNGEPFKTFTQQSNHFEFAIDDGEPLDTITLKPRGEGLPFVYYYIRATQTDGHIAWGSPIWIDYVAGEGKKNVKKK